jgi:L-fuconolactonase
VIIDAHHHIWDPDTGDYPWMTGEAASLKRVFSPTDLRTALQGTDVTVTVLVQTWHSLEETRDFLRTAAATDLIAGVVGWVDLTDPAVADTIDALQEGPHGEYLVGLRHLVHDEPDADWLLRPDVRRGLAAVQAAGLTYDLLVRPRELPAAIATVRAFPGLRFVVDHIAKPDIKSRTIEPWRSLMRQFREHRNHVWCKLSGMATESDRQHWQSPDLAPYIATALEVFDPDRCMYGSDWPVSNLAGPYSRILKALQVNLEALTEQERADVFAHSAIAAYRLVLSESQRAATRQGVAPP